MIRNLHLILLYNLAYAQFNAEVYKTNNYGHKELNPSIMVDQNTYTGNLDIF